MPEVEFYVCQVIVIVKTIFVLYRDVEQVRFSVMVYFEPSTGRPRGAHLQGRSFKGQGFRKKGGYAIIHIRVLGPRSAAA